MSINWKCTHFSDLSLDELYAILRLRAEVFVVEQNCAYQDLDNKDPHCYHVTGWLDDKLIASTRLVPAGISYDEPSIGRVVTSPDARGIGAGRELMNYSIQQLYNIWGNQPIRIGAQLYLKKFYESLGFAQTSEVYLEDGIEHIEMLVPILEAKA